MKIACVQQAHNPGHVRENREKALHYAASALEQGAEIVLFHEWLLTGCDAGIPAMSEPLNGETTQAFQRLLRGTQAKIIYGLTESTAEGIYNSAPVVTQDGVIANYRKVHRWWKDTGARDETATFLPGNALVSFPHGAHRYGLLICYDGDFPEMFRAYAKMGCAGVFWLNNRESRGHLDRCTTAATDNSLIVATSCCCGVNEWGHAGRGLSNIVDCDGTLLAEIDSQEGVICADVDPARTCAMRAQNPWFTGLRPDLY